MVRCFFHLHVARYFLFMTSKLSSKKVHKFTLDYIMQIDLQKENSFSIKKNRKKAYLLIGHDKQSYVLSSSWHKNYLLANVT